MMTSFVASGTPLIQFAVFVQSVLVSPFQAEGKVNPEFHAPTSLLSTPKSTGVASPGVGRPNLTNPLVAS